MAMTTEEAIQILDETQSRLNTGILETYMAVDADPRSFSMEEERAWSILKPQFQALFAPRK